GLQAALGFVDEQAASDGNTFLLLEELWGSAARLLEVGDTDSLESALRSLVLGAELVLEGDRVYRTELWEMECRLGAELGKRARGVPSELFEEPRRPELQVSDEQWAVVELVRTRPLVLMTGL